MKNNNLKIEDVCENMNQLTSEGECKLINFMDFFGEKILCVDNDSTVMDGEIVDTLAEVVGGGSTEKIMEITNTCMNGDSEMSFEESLRQRINILVEAGLNKIHFEKCVNALNFSKGFENLVKKTFEAYGTVENKIFILSGGFEEVIKPKIFELDLVDNERKILANQVFANSFLLDGEKVIGVDFESENKNMWREYAKSIRIKKLREIGLISDLAKILAVGDGSNDCDMIGDESEGLFVTYSGVVSRKNTIKRSYGVECGDFYEIERVLFG